MTKSRRLPGWAAAATRAGLAGLLAAAPAHPVGQLLSGEVPHPVRHTFVRAHLVDGAAVTRVEQRFATAPGGEAAYRATIPAAAEVTDLVMWVGDRRAQGTILSARSAAQFDGIALLERTAVSADGGTQVVGLDLDLPVDDELLVQLEYMETLPARAGRREYRLPLSVTSDSVSVVVEVASAAGVEVAAAGPLADAAQVTPRADGATVRAAAGAFAADGELVLTVDAPEPAPRVRSWRPSKGDGFYAAWLPVTEAMAGAQTLPPALSVVVDLSAQDEAVIAAVRQGLEALIEALPESGLVAVAARGRDTAGVGLAPATSQGKASALAALQDVGAPVGEPGIDGGLEEALRAALGPRPVTEGRPHYLLIVTDEAAPEAGAGARALIESLALDPLVRGWVVQPDGERGDSLADALARLLRSPLLTPSGATATSQALRGLGATLARRHAYIGRIDVPQAGAWDLVPPRVGWTAVGDEAAQMGRYRTSGTSLVRVHGLTGSVDAEGQAALAEPDTGLAAGAEDAVLLSEDFDDGGMGAFVPAGGTSGQWHVDPVEGVLRVSRVREIGRAVAVVPASSYTIQVRMRVLGAEGKIILMQADRHEYRRVDVFRGGQIRVITAAATASARYPTERGRWHDLRVEVGQVVRVWVDGTLVHDGVPLGDEVPDGAIGLGAYAADSVAFDDVLVLRGTASEAGFVQGTGRLLGLVDAGGCDRLIRVPGADRLACGRGDEVTLWPIPTVEAETGKEVRSIEWTGDLATAAVSPQGRTVAAGYVDGTVLVWDVDSRQSSRIVVGKARRDAVPGLAFGPDGLLAAADLASEGAVDSGQVALWNLDQQQLTGVLVGGRGRARQVSFSADGRFVAAVYADEVRLWERSSGALWLTVPCRELTLSADGTRMALARCGPARAEGSGVELWDLAGHRQLAELTGHEHPVRAMAFAPDGSLLATVGANVQLWDLEAMAPAIGFEPVAGNSVAFSHDGRRLVTGDAEGGIRLWQVWPWREVAQAVGDAGQPVAYVGFAPGDRWVVSMSAKHPVRLWDAADGLRYVGAQDHHSPVQGVVFSADGSTMVTASQRGGIWVTGEPRATAIAEVDVATGQLPTSAQLWPAYPNPFNPATAIRYALPRRGPVRVSIYSSLGQRVRVLVDEEQQEAGPHAVVWDGRDAAGEPLASGVYLFRLRTPESERAGKMVLLR